VGNNDPLHFSVPWSIRNFTGRDEDLRELLESLKQKSCLTVVSGMGGVGKTCLVRQFVNRKEVADWNILWLASETEQDLQKTIMKAADCVAQRIKGNEKLKLSFRMSKFALVAMF